MEIDIANSYVRGRPSLLRLVTPVVLLSETVLVQNTTKKQMASFVISLDHTQRVLIGSDKIGLTVGYWTAVEKNAAQLNC